jgi:nitrite reductase/ring-hydroxylating ferredoxin subunit
LFDIRDGSVVSMPAVVPVPAYEAKVEGDDIWVESPDF